MKLLYGDLQKPWTTFLDDGHKDLKIEMGELEQYNGIPVMRAAGMQNQDVLTCFRCYGNSDSRMQYDPNASDFEY